MAAAGGRRLCLWALPLLLRAQRLECALLPHRGRYRRGRAPQPPAVQGIWNIKHVKTKKPKKKNTFWRNSKHHTHTSI
eukprot:956246-Prorocentrum_minimum.AAC.2